MKTGDKVGIVCCSNGQPQENQERIEQLQSILRKIGLEPVLSAYIYQKESVFSGTGKERAQALMDFYRDKEIKAIFDISGGDLANEILPYLDYEIIGASDKMFWGYSDLTTVINAIYAKTGNPSVLYQIRNLLYSDQETQIRNFTNTMLRGQNDLYKISYHMVQGQHMEGIVVGGNIRCLLKLAGTQYWPDMTGKILLLEAYSGKVPQMVTFLNQLQQMGVFEKINGILLGTFTQMEKEQCQSDIVELVKRYTGTEVPIAKTQQIGHGVDAKGILIGEYACL